MRATKFLTEQEKGAAREAIAEAERRTSAEILCAVATESGRYDRAEAVVGLAGALLGLWVVQVAAGILARCSGSWEAEATVHLGWQAAGVVAGFVVGNLLAGCIHPLRRLFVPNAEMEAETARAASRVFLQQRMASTRARGGVLLYVSLFERSVVVLADSGARDTLGREGVEALRDLAVARLRAGERAGTLLEMIRAAADRLAQRLPAGGDDTDELPDLVQIYHPRP